MKTVKLYACGTAWNWDTDKRNAGSLEFYMSKKALQEDSNCSDQCGIVEVEATLKRNVTKPSSAMTTINKEKTLERDEEAYELATKLLAEMSGYGYKTVLLALAIALAKIKKERRKDREALSGKRPRHKVR